MGLFSKALPVLGAIGGFMIGGPIGAGIGAGIGSALAGGGRKKGSGGSASPVQIELPTSYGPKLSDLRTLTSGYGDVIPKVYGKMRLSGNIIWATDLKEIEHSNDEVTRSNNSVTKRKLVTYEYFASFAVAICEGPINEIIRIWVGDRLVPLQELSEKCKSFTIYNGSADQMPDPFIASTKSPGCCPAYRDLAYVVFEQLPLGDYDNRIPNLSFEVRREVRFRPAIEDKIKEIVLIPGAGEFVYSTMPSFKISGEYIGQDFVEMRKESLNMHNHEGRVNSVVALDQMQKALPNLEWVALVITWFATSSNAAHCKIIPKVEYHDTSSRNEPFRWSVAGLSRTEAECVLKFDDESLTYGGTPSDHSVIEICKELEQRGLKVMLYPMIFVDEIYPKPKPWRGRIKASSVQEISNWFNGPSGYSNFIKHYAALTKGMIDAFVIGSEMIGLTSFSNEQNSYPAVDEFIKLARDTKHIVGSNCIVTYAADWSEYHHTDGGWYNLDPLWACDAIDVVGIDAYFPLTEDLPSSMITEELIKQGWESGEGWSYYYADEKRQTKKYFGTNNTASIFESSTRRSSVEARNVDNYLSTDDRDDQQRGEQKGKRYDYAWKNVEYWWKSHHRNPNGDLTEWQPKMKPIWFTEMGFPSVDACSNQPNVFYDPSSVESFFPRSSKGKVDFFAQRQALSATLDFLKERRERSGAGNEELVAKSFIWTWDARPYPCWPDMLNIWQDGRLWQTGHWLNGKIGFSTLGAIIADILSIAGFREDEYDVSLLTQDVEGFIIAENCTIREVIEQLKAAYFFDVIETGGRLKFIPRESAQVSKSNEERDLSTINYDDLVVPNKIMATGSSTNSALEINIEAELELPQRVSLTYIDPQQSYNYSSTGALRSTSSSKQHVDYSLPLVMSSSQAKKVADIALYEAWTQRMSFAFNLGPRYSYLEPADIITLIASGVSHQIRITSLDVSSNNLIKLQGVAHDVSVYDFYCRANYTSNVVNTELPEQVPDTILNILDIPYVPGAGSALSDPNRALITFACTPNSSNWQGAIIYMSTDGQHYKQLCTVSSNDTGTFGKIKNILPAAALHLKDTTNEIIVDIYMGAKLPTAEEQFTQQSQTIALVGSEIIIYEHIEKLQESDNTTTYALKTLSRGLLGTSYHCHGHKKDERFVFLGGNLATAYIEDSMIGQELYFKAVSIGSSLAASKERKIKFEAISLKPLEATDIEIKPIEADDNVSSVSSTEEEQEYIDLEITWLRQDRRQQDHSYSGAIPMSEQQELYEIEIYQGMQILRVLSSSESRVIYSGQMQEADGLQPGEEYEVSIYQISSKLGRGYPASAKFTI